MAEQNLKEQEDRLRFLVSRIEGEIQKFSGLMQELRAKQENIQLALRKHGFEPVPIKIAPSSTETDNLLQELEQHILELNKMKNFVSEKMKDVVKEEELRKNLQEEFGTKLEIKKTANGEFELDYLDEDTQNYFNQMQGSKKIMQQLRQSLSEMKLEK